jgi:phosphatidylserine decarboxylase
MTIHKEGTATLSITALILLSLNTVLYINASPFSFGISLLFSSLFFLFILQFFRVPKRNTAKDANTIVSPCDGKVVVIEEVEEPEYYKGKRLQVSIFMSPTNVHINWAPISGKVTYSVYHPGKYLVAWHPKSSTENERTSIVFDNGKQSVLIRQVAGALARRIMYYTKENMSVEQGQEVGFIKFGSRVDLYLPLNTKISVKLGDVVTGCESTIGHFPLNNE